MLEFFFGKDFSSKVYQELLAQIRLLASQKKAVGSGFEDTTDRLRTHQVIFLRRNHGFENPFHFLMQYKKGDIVITKNGRCNVF